MQSMSSTSTNHHGTMNTMFRVHYSGKAITITVTNKASMVTTWINELLSVHNGKPIIVGLDCEWRHTDIWGFGNKIATLQLCVDNKCLILQLHYMDTFPESLVSFLGDSKNTFVGVEVDDDVMKLRDDYGLKCKKTADIRALALSGCTSYMQAGYPRKPGLKALASRVVGIEMEKPILVCKSDWQARELSKEQIKYACFDAYASYSIGYKLLIEKKSRSKLLLHSLMSWTTNACIKITFAFGLVVWFSVFFSFFCFCFGTFCFSIDQSRRGI